MEAEVYERMARLENRHWWFRGRRRILRHLLRRFTTPDRPVRILEAGCGTGGNLEMLSAFGEVKAFEPEASARIHARRTGCEVQEGRLPADHPFAGECFDLILLADVLEHVEEDGATLKALGRCLAEGGNLLLTVPACPFLWSRHDELHRHYRRYRKAELRDLLEDAGLEIRLLHYYNFWFFPVVALVRWLRRESEDSRSDETHVPAKPLNRLAEAVLAGERHFLLRTGFPVGVSLVAVAGRPAGKPSWGEEDDSGVASGRWRANLPGDA